MKITSSPLPGVVVIQPNVFSDARGEFVKTYHAEIFAELGIDFIPREEFFSVSHANVLRGMHFQLPPHAHSKLVYCIKGRVLDVLLDLRVDSPAFGSSCGIELSRSNFTSVYVPIGVAHGFLSLEDETTMVYKTSSVYAPSHDAGVHWDSFGFQWPLSVSPCVSFRDSQFSRFSQSGKIF